MEEEKKEMNSPFKEKQAILAETNPSDAGSTEVDTSRVPSVSQHRKRHVYFFDVFIFLVAIIVS